MRMGGLAAFLLAGGLCAACQAGPGMSGRGGPDAGPTAFGASRDLAQPLGVVRMAGVGDDLVTLTRESAVDDGDGDILGRTGRGGMTVLSYAGLQDGAAVLERRDVVVYAPEGQARVFLDGGRAAFRLDPATLPQTMIVDGVYVRLIEADRFIIRFLLSRNPL